MMNAVDWPNGPFFLHVFLDDGSGWKDLGTTQLLSVPFAFVAGRVIEKDTATPPPISLKTIHDGDGNTSIHTELYPDENLIRVNVNGLERWVFKGNALETSNSGKSLFIGKNAGLYGVSYRVLLGLEPS